MKEIITLGVQIHLKYESENEKYQLIEDAINNLNFEGCGSDFEQDLFFKRVKLGNIYEERPKG